MSNLIVWWLIWVVTSSGHNVNADAMFSTLLCNGYDGMMQNPVALTVTHDTRGFIVSTPYNRRYLVHCYGEAKDGSMLDLTPSWLEDSDLGSAVNPVNVYLNTMHNQSKDVLVKNFNTGQNLPMDVTICGKDDITSVRNGLWHANLTSVCRTERAQQWTDGYGKVHYTVNVDDSVFNVVAAR